METIKATVINVIREMSSKKEKGINQTDAWALLKKALTKKELRHIKFNYFKKGILGIKVDSSAWLYNLNLKKEKLMAFFDNSPGMQLKDIRFNLGEIK